jgi:dipeptide/tripeptide permease
MKRITRRIASIVRNEPTDRPSEGASSFEAFYQQMFDRDIYLHVSEISVAMIGVCLTGVSILNVDEDINKLNTYVDDLLAIDAFFFLAAYLMSYWVVRLMTKSDRNVRIIGNLANIIFLMGMIFMVVVCGSIVLQGDYSLVDP